MYLLLLQCLGYRTLCDIIQHLVIRFSQGILLQWYRDLRSSINRSVITSRQNQKLKKKIVLKLYYLLETLSIVPSKQKTNTSHQCSFSEENLERRYWEFAKAAIQRCSLKNVFCLYIQVFIQVVLLMSVLSRDSVFECCKMQVWVLRC